MGVRRRDPETARLATVLGQPIEEIEKRKQTPARCRLRVPGRGEPDRQAAAGREEEDGRREVGREEDCGEESGAAATRLGLRRLPRHLPGLLADKV
ncbi:hypothetical protein ACWEQ3_46475 [Streptomyces mirabilis]